MMDVMMMRTKAVIMKGESNGEEKSYKERDDGYATNCDDNDSNRDENVADGYFSDEEGVDEGDGSGCSSDLGNYYGDNEGNTVDESSGFSSMESDDDSGNECDDKHDDNDRGKRRKSMHEEMCI